MPSLARIVGQEDVIDEMRRRAPRRGMRKGLAMDLGISEPALCGMIGGRRPISAEVAARLGFRIRYEREEGNS
jgi:plasmid maintenance system antidote protein VapI